MAECQVRKGNSLTGIIQRSFVSFRVNKNIHFEPSLKLLGETGSNDESQCMFYSFLSGALYGNAESVSSLASYH